MSLSAPIHLETRTSIRLPLFSASVEAGFPSPADDHLERGIDLNEELISHPAASFLLRVNGESMREANIHTGDVLIVDKSLVPVDRKIVVAMIDGNFTVKRFRKRGDRVFLEAENPEFNPIEVTDGQELTIFGVVTYIIHQAK